MLLSKWQCMLRNKSIKCESNWPITKNWDKLQNETGGSSKNTNWLTIRSNFKLEIQAHKTLTTDAPMALLCTTANFFGGKYDLFQLHRQIIHQNDGISMINWLESSPLAQIRKMTRLHLLFGLFFSSWQPIKRNQPNSWNDGAAIPPPISFLQRMYSVLLVYLKFSA